MQDIKKLIAGIEAGSTASHAYIIEGPAGESKDAFINTLISGLLCLDEQPEGRPCGHCEACVQVAAETHPDTVFMQMSGKTGYTKVDALSFMERLGMRSYGRYLVGVIRDAELMSEIVQNKLLKTIEEPAPGTLILLSTARSDALLLTVRSRCRLIRMAEYEGFEGTDAYDVPADYSEGVFMLLTQQRAFHEFREFLDKNIKTADDAIKLIEMAENKLRGVMREGKAADFCAERIEAAEMAASDIKRGMDKNKALKRLYLKYNGYEPQETGRNENI